MNGGEQHHFLFNMMKEQMPERPPCGSQIGLSSLALGCHLPNPPSLSLAPLGLPKSYLPFSAQDEGCPLRGILQGEHSVLWPHVEFSASRNTHSDHFLRTHWAPSPSQALLILATIFIASWLDFIEGKTEAESKQSLAQDYTSGSGCAVATSRIHITLGPALITTVLFLPSLAE